MSKNGKLAVVVAMGVLAAGAAWAGTHSSQSVTVDATNRQAFGAMGTAYNSADANQYLGCVVASYSTGSVYVNCYARDAAGNSATCTTSLTELVKVAQTINSDSYVRFFWDASGSCTFLQVSNLSYWDKK